MEYWVLFCAPSAGRNFGRTSYGWIRPPFSPLAMEREKLKASRRPFSFEWASIFYRRSSRRQTQYLRMSPPFVRRSYRMLDAWNCLMVLSDRTLGIDVEHRTPLYIIRATVYFFHETSLPSIALDIWTAASLRCSKVKYACNSKLRILAMSCGLRQRRHCILHKIRGKNFFLEEGDHVSRKITIFD